MRRLNEAELDARIHKFLGRKLYEFPELYSENERPHKTWRARKTRELNPRLEEFRVLN